MQNWKETKKFENIEKQKEQLNLSKFLTLA